MVEFEMVQLQIMILRPCLDPWTKTFGIKFSLFGDPNRLNCRLKFSSTPTKVWSISSQNLSSDLNRWTKCKLKFSPLVLKTYPVHNLH